MDVCTFISVWSDQQSHVDSTLIFVSQNSAVIKSTLQMINSDVQLLVVSSQAIRLISPKQDCFGWTDDEMCISPSPKRISNFPEHHRSVCSSHWWLTIPYLLQLGAGIIGGPWEEAHPDSALTSINPPPHKHPHTVGLEDWMSLIKLL